VIDLHMHSMFSDGTEPPETLIDLAVKEGLTAVAITDHDTVKGVPRFQKAAQQHGITGIAGVEVSTSSVSGEMHMLGYFMNHRDTMLAAQLDWIRSARQARNEEILHKLHKLGMHLNWREIRSFAMDDVIGRPHFARAMVARGYCNNTKEAFSRFLSRGCPGYAPRRTLTAEEALEIIRGAGGVPVLAHPFTLRLNLLQMEDLLAELRRMGLEGIETYYTQHTPDQVRTYLGLAEQFDLVPTGGTDYHGAATPDLRLGVGFGSLRVPDEVVDRLHARRPAG
jgi:3',5'-nucleoside bisphosphate phosphatase